MFYLFFSFFQVMFWKGNVFASRIFFWSFFCLIVFFSTFGQNTQFGDRKNPSLTKVLRKGSTLWAGLGWVWGGKRWDEVGILWCSHFVVHPGKSTFGTPKKSWRFGRKMKTAGFQRGDFIVSKAVFFFQGVWDWNVLISVSSSSPWHSMFGLGWHTSNRFWCFQQKSGCIC